jgi:hypothetical protein
MELNDELLCAYLDGELDEAMRARVAAALESDAGGRVRLERMRVADERLRRDLPPRAAAGVDSVAEYILRHAAQPAAARRGPRRWQLPVAIAAAAACVAFGFVLARLQVPASVADLRDGDLAGPGLQSVLESRPSGERASRDGLALTVELTMTARDGSPCRLFEAHGAGTDAEGVACREARGWRVVALDRTVPPGAGFHTAGASPLLDLVMDRLEATTLDPAQERALLARGWRPDTR